jgi:hypothetical protein
MKNQLDIYRSALAEQRSNLTELKARRVVHDTPNIKQSDLNDRLIAELEGQILELEAGIKRLEMPDPKGPRGRR